MNDKVGRSAIVEINEISLINELAERTKDWVKTLRFTKELSTEKNVTDEEKSTTPTIYKYYFPKGKVTPKSDLPVGMINADEVENRRLNRDDGVERFAPAVIIRPTTSTIGLADDGDYEDVGIDFVIEVSEHDILLRYQNLALAKNAIIQGLRTTKQRNVSNYKLDWNIEVHPSDDTNEPKAIYVVSTTWRRYLAPIALRSLDEIM